MRNIIFDFNGTLYQDTPMHIASWGEFYRRRGVPYSEELFYKYMCGPPNSDILRRMLRPDLTDDEVHALSEEKERIYRDIILRDPKLQTLTPGAEEMLTALKARGVPFAIATGADLANIEFYAEVLGIYRWFDLDHIFYSTPGIPGKPDPAIYRLAMEKLGYDPSNTLVVEDGMDGIRSAIGAGVRAIVAIDTTLGAAAFRDMPEVSAVIHDFCDFERFIDL